MRIPESEAPNARSYDELVQAARKAYDEDKNYEEAQRLLNLAINSNDSWFEAYSVLGVIYWLAGDLRKAEQAYLSALKRDGAADLYVVADRDWGWLSVPYNGEIYSREWEVYV